MVLRRVDILHPLYNKLKFASESEIEQALVYGILDGGVSGVVTAVTLIKYVNEESLQLATSSLPHGLQLIGLVEFESDEQQDIYGVVENLENPILLKVSDQMVTATTGLDFLTEIGVNVIQPEQFWSKQVTTFRITGEFLVHSLLEGPDLNECFSQAKIRVLNQSAYTLGKEEDITLLPRHGHILYEKKIKGEATVGDIVKIVGEYKEDCYFCPGMSLVSCRIYFDQTKSNSHKKATLLISDTTPRCKLFEHYLPIDLLVVVPKGIPAYRLYKRFNLAFLNQLNYGFKANITEQLLNSISAEKPETFHFWVPTRQHFVTSLYPDQTSEEKLKDIRLQLHELLFIKEIRPYFRRNASLFPSTSALISPHLNLKKESNTVVIKGHYEYKHYMQDDFDDNGWGCAYRSLQTLVSWFRLQGFTSRPIPTHKEIQECLVSLGDKPITFIGSRQWIGSTEVSFVMEALLGVSCRILNLPNGAGMSSRETLGSLSNHFRSHGTPVMIGGGMYAHTIIGVSDESEEIPAFLVLDPHWTGGEELKTILGKGWVGWKDKKFWSANDFYNICMPMITSSI